MSDVERPSNTPSRSGPPSGAPVRNMADIAKLFLDGARAAGAAGGASSNGTRRVPPATGANGGLPAEKLAEPTGTAGGAAGGRVGRRDPLREEVSHKSTSRPEAQGGVPSARQTVLMALALPAADETRGEGRGWRMLSDAAAGMAAEQGTTVALVGMQPDRSGRPQLVIDVHGAESADELPATRPMAGVIDLQLAQALFTLRPAIGLWMIAAPDPGMKGFSAASGRLQEWLLACPTENDGLIAAYQHFKKAWVLAQRTAGERVMRTPSAFLLTDDFAHAAVVHQRMRKAAQEFLKTDLQLAGVGCPGEGSDSVRVLSLPASPSTVESLWSCILDELCPGEHEADVPPAPSACREQHREPLPASAHSIEEVLEHVSSTADDVVRHSASAAGMMLDHLAQVLDPEEREALSASFEDIETTPFAAELNQRAPEDDIRTLVIPPPPVPETVAGGPRTAAKATAVRKSAPPPAAAAATVAHPPAMAAPVGVTLRAFDVIDAHDESRASQWAAVERSVRDLVPGSVLLEARPPMSWASEACIAIDPDGRLHVWTLYKDGASWFALREWASEHRDLLALTRRDLVLSKELQVAVHIVLPLEAAPDTGEDKNPSVVSTIMRTPVKNIHLYRLRVLHWNARRGLVVVPLS